MHWFLESFLKWKNNPTTYITEKMKYKCETDLIHKWRWVFSQETINPKHIIDKYHIPGGYSKSGTVQNVPVTVPQKYACMGYSNNSIAYIPSLQQLVRGLYFCSFALANNFSEGS